MLASSAFIGAVLSFVGSRITTFGLADMRGGLHFGFDEGHG